MARQARQAGHATTFGDSGPLELEPPDITADIAHDSGGLVISLKLQAGNCELNVFLNANDADTILNRKLPVAPDEKALAAGDSCGATAHWSVDSSGVIGIVIGFDDTTWDFGIWMPNESFENIKTLVAGLRPKLP